jgi:hypothetical protein
MNPRPSKREAGTPGPFVPLSGFVHVLSPYSIVPAVLASQRKASWKAKTPHHQILVLTGFRLLSMICTPRLADTTRSAPAHRALRPRDGASPPLPNHRLRPIGATCLRSNASPTLS